ncbi:MAG: RluA family pseudouridine synthase [Pirellulales bacterium]|nr:RluA family pseudouridine synthase [Pirellulales bacterium]
MPKTPKNGNSKSLNFHVSTETVGLTLAAALRQWLPKHSWSRIKQQIESRFVLVNGNVCLDAGRRLQADEVVKVLENPAVALPKEHDVQVQYLDQHIVVVEKPAGMTTNRHREERRWPKRRKQIQPTLDEVLPRIIAQIEGRRGNRGVLPPVRAVHRLDRETSGLIVFARTHEAERLLAQQFRKHTTHRRYVAVVVGQVEAQTITSQLVRDRGDGRRGSTKELGVGKTAVTHVKPIEYAKGSGFRVQGSGYRRHPARSDIEHPASSIEHHQTPGDSAAYTLIQCRLETGRTHQIRIHLSESGHPVCGDKLYRNPPFKPPRPDHSGATRLALHAAELGFVHPTTGKNLRFQSPPPQEFRELWKRLMETGHP